MLPVPPKVTEKTVSLAVQNLIIKVSLMQIIQKKYDAQFFWKFKLTFSYTQHRSEYLSDKYHPYLTHVLLYVCIE